MTIPGAELTKAEVDQIAWQEVVAGCSEKECSAYEQAFYEKAREAQTAGNTEAEALFALLGIICSFHLKLDEPDEPFVPALVFQTGRSPSPEDLSDAHLDLLQQLAPEVADPELRARVADVIWVCPTARWQSLRLRRTWRQRASWKILDLRLRGLSGSSGHCNLVLRWAATTQYCRP